MSADFSGNKQKIKLHHLFSDLYLLILQLRSNSNFGDINALRKNVKELLSQTAKKAENSEFHEKDIRRAQFALVAFLDETIISSEWAEKYEWLNNPLQLELFNLNDAGEKFFQLLSTLRESPRKHHELLEVFYLCLALGYKGKYLIYDQDQLRNIIEDLHLTLKDNLNFSADQLSPNGLPKAEVLETIKRDVPGWIYFVVSASIGLIIYFILSVFISGSADKIAKLIQRALLIG